VRGRRIRYSAAELAFVKSNCAMSRRSLHAAFSRVFGRTDVKLADIKSLCSRNGWTTSRKRWHHEDDALLAEIYPDTSTVEVASRLGRSIASTYMRAQQLGLQKGDAYLASPAACRLRRGGDIGAVHRFTKGHVPANKGKPMPFNANSAATRFKKGERRGVAVKLYKPIGTERLSKDGYLERKIHDGLPLQSRWRAVHLVRWEEINGSVPKGMALKCLGDKRNTDPSNWELVARALLPRLNGKHGRGYDSAPSELKPTIMAIAKLEHAARNRPGGRGGR
jgi:hypothetical protein